MPSFGGIAKNGLVFAAKRFGYDLDYDALTNHGGHLVLSGARVAATGREPLLRVRRLDVTYSLFDLFGKGRPFGISRLEIDEPRITIVHHRDGSYNFVVPKQNTNQRQKPFEIPRIALVVRDGSAAIDDRTRLSPASRHLGFEKLSVDAQLDPNARSRIRASLAILEQGRAYPIDARGRLDDPHGYEFVRITSRSLPLAPLVNYAIDSPSLAIGEGRLERLDATVYGVRDRTGTIVRHLAATARLASFRASLGGIAKPLRDAHGSLAVYDDGLAIERVDGTIANVPVRIAGAIFDLAKPHLRLGIGGRGELSDLARLSSAARTLPLGGPIAFSLFVEGDATKPQTLATFSSPRITYQRIPIDAPSGLVALQGQEATLVRAAIGYDGATAGARAALTLAKHTDVDLLAAVEAPASRFPYAAQLLGPMTVRATVVATGRDAALQTTAIVAGETAATRLLGTIDVGPRGEGSIGPIAIEGPGERNLYARVALDRPNAGGGAAFVALRGFTLSTLGSQPALPGLSLPALPPLRATADADLAATFNGKRFTGAGSAHAYDTTVRGYPIEDLTARGVASDGARAALVVRYRGDLAPLARAAKTSIAVRGRVDLPISIVAAGTSDAVAQIAGARFAGVRIGDTNVGGIEGTFGLRGTAVDVYGARLELDGRDVAARGRFGGGGTLDVSTDGIELASLRALGLPVRGGTVNALAAIGGSVTSPNVDAGIAATGVRAADPRVAGLALSASTDLRYAGGTLVVRDGSALAGSAVGTLEGRIDGIRGDPKRASYAFDVAIQQADIGTFATLFHVPQYPEGSLDATLRVAGTGASPNVAGRIAIPEGSINGLGFREASVVLAGSAGGIDARDGRVTIGSTAVAFAANVTQTRQRFSLRAPHLDLTDLNGYFDQGDTLGGEGSLAATLWHTTDRIVASGRVAIARTRFHRFDLGETRAIVATNGRRIATNLVLGGASGTISTNTALTLPQTLPLRDTLRRSYLSASARATAIDLAVWLPAAQIQAPVIGKIDGRIAASGYYPRVSGSAHAALSGGEARGIPIRTATLDASAANGRASIGSAVLAIDHLSARASGSFALEPRGPVDLTLSANAPDVGALAKTLTRTAYDASGSLTTTLRVTGTLQRLRADDTLDAASLRYARFTIPRVHTELAIRPTSATLRSAEIDLESGRLLATGAVPLVSKPAFGIGPATAPIAFRVNAERIDLAQFAALLPKGTQVTGLIDGGVGLVGTLATPGLAGTLALTGGSFVGPLLRSKVTAGVAQITFAGTSATLHDTSVRIGGGTISATGRASVPDLRHPANDANGSLAIAFANPVVDAPKYLKGRIDGTLTIARAPNAPIDVGGKLAFSSVRIPLSAVFSPQAKPQASAAPVLPVRFDLGVAVGRDVRLQSGPVDVGATGDLTIGGTLAAPTVMGQLESVGGGTLSFYRTFQVQDGSTLAFSPSDGVIPDVDVNATTSVPNPATDVALHVTGPATMLNVDLTSDPAYSREQILGLLVGLQAFGAVSGVAPTTQGAAANPFQAAAAGELGTLLTQNVLQPFSSQLGGALGLSDLAVQYVPGGAVSIGAKKKILKNLSLVYASSLGYPRRESVGALATNSANTTAVQLTFFTQQVANQFSSIQTSTLFSTNPSVSASEPSNGSNGFSLSLQRKF